MWADHDYVMISAIEHYSYCPRQCALIHVEQVFDENMFTLRGRAAHTRADQSAGAMEASVRIERALPLWSDRLGLVGRADVVEFRADGTVYPVEYKHGVRRVKIHDDLQLCAQAVCLEEMLDISVLVGAVYYHSTHRRREVVFTPELRAEMERIVARIRQMQRAGTMPPPWNDSRCRHCSLADACMPDVLERSRFAYHLRRLYVPEASGVLERSDEERE
ncbi:MAG: CRISPR-associated protein Cas4 [Chloroherpetonaceae bacterium]|nr:CRISPR-associated protein Cas4 [Chloroherpetonaceae bacterium]